MANQLTLDDGTFNENESQVTPFGLTRVMSPNDAVNNSVLCVNTICGVYKNRMSDPSMCAGCGIYGHVICMGGQLFQGYVFCPRCINFVRRDYELAETQQRQLFWTEQIRGQFTNWKREIGRAHV